MYSVCIYIVKVVSYYDLSILSMSVMGFQKKLYPSLFCIFGIVLTLQIPCDSRLIPLY